jgi:predicted ferric reductase
MLAAMSALAPPRPSSLSRGRVRGSLRAPAPPVRRWVPGTALTVATVGLVVSIALPFTRESAAALSATGGAATFLGDVTAMAGTYLLLVMVLLAARLPALERAVGQDRLLRWHRRLASAPLLLLLAHGVLTALGFAQAANVGIVAETGTLLFTMRWILASVVAYVLLAGIAILSIRAARRRLSYDTWWVIHLYTYLALALAVPHQIIDGIDFAGRPMLQAAWLTLWLSTAGLVIAFRVGLPLWRSLRHQLRVVSVTPECAGAYEIVLRGRAIDRLGVRGGQYFAWRFLTRGLWWHAHPFSLSAMPRPPHLRITVKALGDTSAQLAALRPGTRVALEGPYGAFTEDVRTSRKVALVGAGVGITPIRAVLEDLPRDVDVVVVQRATDRDELYHHDEIERIVASRGGRMITLVGSRGQHRLDEARSLKGVVPDIVGRDVYVCGPDGFSAGVQRAARALGVPPSAIHLESFAL